MEQPKRELRLSLDEKKRNASVTEQSSTGEFKNNAKETQGLDVNEKGKATPIVQKRKIQIAKPGSGKKTRVIGEDGSVLYELEPGSEKEKATLQKVRLQEKDTNSRRTKSAEVMNYQTGDTDGNRVFEERYAAQQSRTARKVFIKK